VAIVHIINRDYKDIGDYFKKLGFISEDVDLQPIVPALTKVFDAALAGGGAKSINFNALSADLAQITFEYPFRIPPYFALVIRAIGVLEGIALVGDPDFAIVDSAYPYISQRLLTDESPRLRAALRYMVYGRDGVFDTERLIDLLIAFEDFDEVSKRAGGIAYSGDEVDRDSMDADAEADRVSTALAFFFSKEGGFFREFLLDETTRGVDVLSRSALLSLPDLVPGPAGSALRQTAALVPAPIRALVPDLTPEEETTLRNLNVLLNFFLNRGSTFDRSATDSNSGFSVNGATQTAQRLQPVFQKYSDSMYDFGLRVVARLAELSTVRLLQFGVESLRGNIQRRSA
jgi:aarF domain-containing kinase